MAQRIAIRHVAVSDQMCGTASALIGYFRLLTATEATREPEATV
ncbi:hypothetical protein [Nocardia nepalensis]